MILLRLAWRNILGSGLRTWLNAVVLSLVLVMIVGAQALLKGMNEQIAQAQVATEFGGGQLWHPSYDRYDVTSLDDARGPLPESVQALVAGGAVAPILVVPATIYPEGRLKPVVIKGIDPEQQVLDWPAHFLADAPEEIPVLIGTRMAESTGLGQGDEFVVQWRDRNGTFDAQNATVVQVIRTPVQSMDQGQIWIPLATLQSMTGLAGEATLAVLSQDAAPAPEAGDWIFRSQDYLLQEIRHLVQSKMIGSMFIYAILLFLALLAVFDTQVFAIFRRQREIGTLVALGMTRRGVVGLFTLEGALHGLLAVVLALLYGVPLLSWFARTGWKLPEGTDSYGFAVGDVLYPMFSSDVVLGTGAVVLILTVTVSFLPTRRIARVKPTDALRGRVF